ncbi:acyl-ACP desaturase [Candidatus Microgenomates bacterium]|nr:acyl-ACP desaturase [Candidatus Microgenomates bacterium]
MALEQLRGTIITPAFHRFFKTHEAQMWRMDDMRFDQIDRGLLTEDEIVAVRGAMLVESHNPVYTQVLLDYFRHDHEMAAFIVTWSYEELKHYLALRTYLEATGMVDLVDLEKELTETRAGPWGDDERNFTAPQSFAYTMLQEEITGLFYHGFAQRTKEPTLKRMLQIIGKDEYRHCQWYLYKGKKSLQHNPQALEEVDDLLLRFRMPGPSFMKEYDRYGAAMFRQIPSAINSGRQVMSKLKDLVGFGHMLRLAADSRYRNKLSEEWGVDLKKLVGLG